MDSSVPLMHHNPGDFGLTCLVKKRKNPALGFKLQSWIFSMKRTLLNQTIKSTSTIFNYMHGN